VNNSLKRQPDFEQFLRVLWRKEKPTHLPFYEHIASPGFIGTRTGKPVDRMPPSGPDYWPAIVEFWVGMGYDCIPMEMPLACPTWLGGTSKRRDAASHASEANAVIGNMRDFEQFEWPNESDPIDFSHFERVARLLPEGCKIVGGVAGGPYEWVSQMMGVMGLSYVLVDDPELVELMFEKIGSLHHSANRQLATMDAVGALRQGDDLGFRTATFLSPDQLRKLVFPTYRKMTDEAHANGKPFILHSCGNLAEVYDEIIDDCKIDGKHSFEEAILPVEDFKQQYGDRVTPLGGLDVDFICRRSEEEIRAYARKKIEQCFYDGYYALGTGNSLTDYMPVENYIYVLEEGINVVP